MGAERESAVKWDAGHSSRAARVASLCRRLFGGPGGRDAVRAAAVILVGLHASQAAAGEKRYGPGVTDTEIKIGNTSPYSGPASAFSMVAKTEEAYFRKVNAEGHQRPAHCLPVIRRRVLAAEDGRTNEAAGRERRGSAGLQRARHRGQLGRAKISERQEGAAIVRLERSGQME